MLGTFLLGTEMLPTGESSSAPTSNSSSQPWAENLVMMLGMG
jgi:hypothetical protein